MQAQDLEHWSDEVSLDWLSWQGGISSSQSQAACLLSKRAVGRVKEHRPQSALLQHHFYPFYLAFGDFNYQRL